MGNLKTPKSQVSPGVRANNYYDNFRSYSRQNRLSGPLPANLRSGADGLDGQDLDGPRAATEVGIPTIGRYTDHFS